MTMQGAQIAATILFKRRFSGKFRIGKFAEKVGTVGIGWPGKAADLGSAVESAVDC